jgi:hypothetical protein
VSAGTSQRRMSRVMSLDCGDGGRDESRREVVDDESAMCIASKN